MRVRYLLLLVFLWSTSLFADSLPIVLEKAPINLNDKASLERGAKFFAHTCMACHTLIYLRYNEMAKKAGVLYERMPINVKKWPNDIKPPDLSLEASRRGPDWLYTYLHSFYIDSSRPTGANNLVLPNTAMPYILSVFQGRQILLPKNEIIQGIFSTSGEWYDLLELQTTGTMTPEQFDQVTIDLVNFLTYASAPYQSEQMHIGYFVLIFLLLLFVLVYLLKREYWKEVNH